MFFCEEEGTWSSFRGIREVLVAKGVFCSRYTDRYRCHDVKATVTVLYHPRWIAIRHGPRELARYDVSGKPLKEASKRWRPRVA